jgi:integrase/recombinase XerD
MSEARRLHPQIRAATAETVIGLLAVTGIRSGEAVRLDRGDVDLTAATLTAVSAKGRRSRVLALHPSTVTALTGYLRLRDDTFPAASTPAFFVSSAGRRLGHSTLNTTFRLLLRAAGLEPPPESRARRPRPHDMRHYVDGRVMWPEAASALVAEPRGLVPAT